MSKILKRILITGASGGIGRAVAEALASPETELILHGRKKSVLDELAGKVKSRGGQCKIAMAEISTIDDITSLIEQVGSGQIDVVIHAAGVAFVDDIEKIKTEEWQKSIDINITAPFLITQRLLPQMREGGSIVFLLSVAAKTAFPSWGAYCTSKFALEGFSQVLREELRPRKIRVINIYPAATATEIWDSIPGDWSKENMLSPDKVADAIKYALAQEPSTAVENISLGNIHGNQ